MNSRRAALQKSTVLTEFEKPELMKALVPELISSEDSDNDGSFTVRPLPWRSDTANELHYSLDKKHVKRLSVKSRRMTSDRQRGLASDRAMPDPKTLPTWCLKKK